MQSLNVTRYVRPALATLFGIGCVLLLVLLERRRRRQSNDSTETEAIQPSHVVSEEDRGNASAEIARDTALSKPFQVVEPVNPGSSGSSAKTISHLTKQRNTLFAVSGILLIASLI